jgi:hypothetical protein
MQVKDAVLDMMDKVKRIDKGNSHHYERVDTGKWLAGVTSVTGLLPKDWAMSYGAKEAVKALGYFDLFKGEDHIEDWDYLKAQLLNIQTMNMDEYFKLLHEAKGAFRRKSKDATDIGQEGHDKLEKWIKAKMHNEPLPELPEICKPFIRWTDENVDTFLLSEARICNLKDEYAGTLDALAKMKSGNLAIIDFKFANNVSKGWELQTSAYAKCFYEYGIEVPERYCLRFPKEEFLKVWNKKEWCYERKKNKFEPITYPEKDMDFDYETFVHLRQAFKWINFKGDR